MFAGAYAALSVVASSGAPARAQASVASPSAPHSSVPPAWSAFASTWAGIVAYSATVTAFERAGSRAETLVVDYRFRKPSNVTARIVSGPNPGAILVWDGGPTMSAHLGSGLMYVLQKKLSLHDPSATSPRGSSIDQLSFAYVLDHGQSTPGTVLQRPGEVVAGVATEAVEIVPLAPADDGGLTREVVELSPTTHVPVRILGYEGLTLVRKIDFTNVTLER
jgi:hypothetical protein